MQPFRARAGRNGHFLLGALLALMSGIGLLGFLNWWQNPFFAFQQVLPHISERPPGAILGADRDRQMRWLKHQGTHASADTLLIGASQFLYGMDFCKYPHVDRLALFFLTDGEIQDLLTTVVPTRQQSTTFYISRGILLADQPTESLSRLHMLWRNFLGQQTTQTSFMNLYQSVIPGPPPCAAVPYTARSQDPLAAQMLQKTLGMVQQHVAPPEALDGILRAIEPSCAKFHHRIVILHMPILFLPSSASTVLNLERQLTDPARVLLNDFNRRNTGCTAQLRDYATPFILGNEAKGPPQAQWFDTLHFKPALGQQFLQSILSDSRNASTPGWAH